MSDQPRPKTVSGAKPEIGHYDDFMEHAAHFLYRAYQECGELAEFDLFGAKHVLLSSADAQEAVYRASDDQVSAAAPYQYMVPVFGQGIQYGAPVETERQQVRFMSDGLRPKRMKTYAQVIAEEVEDYISDWGDEGEKEFHDTFKELVLRTSTHCLMGSEFRHRLNDEFGELFEQLEHAISPEAVIDYQSEAEAFSTRDEARARLQEMLMKSVNERLAANAAGDEPPTDMLQSFLDARYKDGEAMDHELIPGMIIWIMFGGFHTSSNTAAWACLAPVPTLLPPAAGRKPGVIAAATSAAATSLVTTPSRLASSTPRCSAAAAASPSPGTLVACFASLPTVASTLASCSV